MTYIKLLSRKHFPCWKGQRGQRRSARPSSAPRPCSLGAAARSPALSALLEHAVTAAAGVVVQVHDAGVALLSFVHPGVPTHFVASLLETLLGLALNGLIDGLFTAV